MLRALTAAVAVSLGIGTAQPEPVAAPTPVPRTVLGAFLADDASYVAAFDPLTLDVQGRRARVHGDVSATARSPDSRTLAVGANELGFTGVELVDLERMRVRKRVDLRTPGWVAFLSWERGHVFAVVASDGETVLLSIDPVGGDVRARHRIPGTLLHVSRGAPQQVVLLFAPSNRIGPLRLAVVGGKGMQTVALDDFVGGWTTEQEGGQVVTRQSIPALAVDRAGQRAFVVSDHSVAEVSLRDLAVRTHSLTRSVSLLKRLQNWVEPSAWAKLVDGWDRQGVWVGDGLIALSGADYSSAEGEHHAMEPVGMSLVDTRDWTIRKVEDAPADVHVAGDGVLVGAGAYDRGGVFGHDLETGRRFDLLAGQSVWLQVAGGLVYASHSDRRFTVLDPATGEVLAEPTAKYPISLIGG